MGFAVAYAFTSHYVTINSDTDYDGTPIKAIYIPLCNY